MENEILDKILAELAVDSSRQLPAELLIEKFNLSGHQWDCRELKFLESEKCVLIGADTKGKAHILITARGLHFIQSGGFTNEATYKNETLQVAKDSKHYAKKAYTVSYIALWVSIIGIAITILLFVLDKLEVF